MGDFSMVTILGVRGSVPVAGKDFLRYGGSTACILIRMGGETIVLDAGTGIMGLEQELRQEERNLHLLLSHIHLDHIIGLPACPVFFNSAYQVDLYVAERPGMGPEETLKQFMSPPLWPVGPEAFYASVSYHAIQGDFLLGGVQVRVMEGTHPGGCRVFRLEYGGCSVVYASDFELEDNSFSKLADFAKGCTLLLCDGQYFDKELEEKRGFGHSSWKMAAHLAKECGAGQLRIVHHDPVRKDWELDEAGLVLEQIFAKGAFARQGEVIHL